MAFKNNVITATAGGPDVVLFTCPVGAEASIHTLFLDSQGGTGQATLKLTLQATGQTVTFLDGFSLADDEPFAFPKAINMTEGDELSLSATGSDIVTLLSAFQDGANGTAASFNPRGEYDNTATYDSLDIVSLSGTSFIAINDGISGDAPPSANWMILAEPDKRRTDQEIRDLFSAGGDLTYNSTTGEFSVTAGADLSTSTTDDLSEGANNLYYTDARARNSVSASGDLNYNSATGVFSITASERPLIQRPENISPADNATGTVLTPELEASAYRSLYGVPMASAQWQISEVSDFATTVVDDTVSGTSTTYTPSSNLDPDSQYFWRVRYTDEDGETSEFSEATTFTTENIFTAQPTITAPADGATDISEQPIIESSAFNTVNGSDTHVASQWVITRTSDGVDVFDSGEDTSNLESIQVPAGVLDEGEESYTVKVRHKGSTYGFSAYSPDSAFTTSSVFFEYNTSNIGQAHGGGFYAGNVVSDVDSQTYAIIVSDGDGDTDRTGAGSKQWRTSNTALTEAQTLADGKSVMDHIVANETLSNFPAFEWIKTTLNDANYNGYSDWYLPARDELELIYRHFKPTTQDNNDGTRPSGTEFGADGATYGTNNSSDPSGSGYTTSDPSQTTVTSFQDGGADYLTDSYYWSSTDYDASYSWAQAFDYGTQYPINKDSTNRVRAVRRIAV